MRLRPAGAGTFLPSFEVGPATDYLAELGKPAHKAETLLAPAKPPQSSLAGDTLNRQL
jgi:hypothetical protein